MYIMTIFFLKKSQYLTNNDLRDYGGITIPYLDF